MPARSARTSPSDERLVEPEDHRVRPRASSRRRCPSGPRWKIVFASASSAGPRPLEVGLVAADHQRQLARLGQRDRCPITGASRSPTPAARAAGSSARSAVGRDGAEVDEHRAAARPGEEPVGAAVDLAPTASSSASIVIVTSAAAATSAGVAATARAELGRQRSAPVAASGCRATSVEPGRAPARVPSREPIRPVPTTPTVGAARPSLRVLEPALDRVDDPVDRRDRGVLERPAPTAAGRAAS